MSDLPQPILVYDRIDGNRRWTVVLLILFGVSAMPFVPFLAEFLMILIGPTFFALQGRETTESDAVRLMIQAGILGIFLAIGIVALAIYLEYRFATVLLLRMVGARPSAPNEEPQVHHLVENLCIGAGLPVPKLYVTEVAEPNAFAVGLDPQRAVIVVTRGLLMLLDRRELEGVLAHELSHIGNYDTRLSTITAGVLGVLRLPISIEEDAIRHRPWIGVPLLLMFLWAFGASLLLPLFVPADVLPDLPPYYFLFYYAFVLYGAYVIFGAYLTGLLIRRSLMHQREFLADADAVLLTRYPEGLARALAKIDVVRAPLVKGAAVTAHLYIVNPLRHGWWWQRIFAHHPPTHKRIALLSGMGLGIDVAVVKAAQEAENVFKPETIPVAHALPGPVAEARTDLLPRSPLAVALIILLFPPLYFALRKRWFSVYVSLVIYSIFGTNLAYAIRGEDSYGPAVFLWCMGAGPALYSWVKDFAGRPENEYLVEFFQKCFKQEKGS